MAKPIKETPILKGKDAERFVQEMEKSKTIKASAETINRIKANYNELKSISKF
jgi:hypothetical protein